MCVRVCVGVWVFSDFLPSKNLSATQISAFDSALLVTNRDQSGKFVSIYLTKGLEGVAEAKVTSSFGEDWFDLQILNLRGRNFRLKKEVS